MYSSVGESLETKPHNSPISTTRATADPLQHPILKQESRLSASSNLRKSVGLRQSPSLTLKESRYFTYVFPPQNTPLTLLLRHLCILLSINYAFSWIFPCILSIQPSIFLPRYFSIFEPWFPTIPPIVNDNFQLLEHTNWRFFFFWLLLFLLASFLQF